VQEVVQAKCPNPLDHNSYVGDASRLTDLYRLSGLAHEYLKLIAEWPGVQEVCGRMIRRRGLQRNPASAIRQLIRSKHLMLQQKPGLASHVDPGQ
jgi:hypothetical protein